MNTEILVHIAAPSTVHHDKRYRAIAEGIIDFKPVNLIRITRDETRYSQINDASGGGPSIVMGPAPDLAKTATLCWPVTDSGSADKAAESSQTRKRKRGHQCCTGSTSFQDSRVLDSFIYRDDQTDADLPPGDEVTSDIHEGCLCANSALNTDRTKRNTRESAVIKRPRTAPASTITTSKVLVPCTERPTRRRALSESFASSCYGSAVLNSQPYPSGGIPSNASQNFDLTTDDLQAMEDYIALSDQIRQAVNKKSMSLSAEDSNAISTEVDSDNDLEATEQPEHQCFFLQDQTLDDMSQSNHSRSAGTVSSVTATPTATPSQQENNMNEVQTVNRPNREDSHPPSSPINLVSDTSISPSQQLQEDLLSSQHSQNTTGLDKKQAESAETARSIDQLDWKIDSPTPNISDGQFLTDLTPRLEDYDKCRPVKEHFLPVKVIRDIRVLERGYWQVPITIAHWSEVEEWRRLNTILRDGPVIAKYRYSPWTAEEFIAFYNRLSDDIRSGHLGSVRLFRLEDCVEPSQADVGITHVNLRLYNWGESVGHLYMAMRWLSESKIEYVPARWIGSDGRIVVTMSGDKYRPKLPRQGRWTRKGGRGGLGTYGIVEEDR